MKKRMTLMMSASFLLCVALVNCKKDDKKDTSSTTTTTTSTTSLYSRLGGIKAISAVVDKFLSYVAADTAINARFSATVADPYRLQLLRNNLIDQVCAGSGGPCQYKGKTMLTAHTGMNITQNEFNALAADLVASLNFYAVGAQ